MAKARQSTPIANLADLTPDPKNARKHGPRNVGTIVDAIHEVGAARSIVIDEHGVILAGNATVEAAAEAGLRKVLVVDADGQTVVAVRRTGLTAKQKARLALYDNRAAELADGWDLDVLKQLQADGVTLDGLWHDDELADLMGLEEKPGLTDPDAVPELRQTDIVRGDLFQLGQHRILCGDSTSAEDVARAMGGEKAALMFTDPPYAIFGSSTGVSNEIADDKMIRPFFRDIFMLARNHTKPFAHLFICCDWRSWSAWWDVAKDCKISVKNCIVWDKGNPAMGAMFRPQHEFILFAVNWYASTANASAERGNQRLIGNETNVWQVSRELSSEKEHNAQKPVVLVGRALLASSDAGSVVIEPFSGSGTTLIACEQLNRRCYAIEIEPAYVQVAIDRWEAFTGQKAVQL